ncbi:uncharacterized protein PV09_01584 [Verruconis gallopava]|uniref:FAD-binding PCMH-type domain-containing protein n=1 Tax=Verruconis gallopava TaxID=253628 RepID=A0A0D1XXW9_9PEZI|nr:uncharacterized protein PV09_01584 [Verruconis gallopava]KIW07641.1 hypothetical protein PV09_01584 [Verruconis gallopava]
MFPSVDIKAHKGSSLEKTRQLLQFTGFSTMTAEQELNELKALLETDEIIYPESPDYVMNSRPFALQKDYKPKLVVRPKTLESLSRTVRYLAESSLQFKVRSMGFGSASAKDVILSMRAFDQFEFDRDKEQLILGVGQPWENYYTKMEQIAPEYSVVSVRTPNIGVGGSTLSGGFSWLSGEHGCLSDPENLLDMQVVKLDGTVIWASEEPDLLWAMRGTEGSFAVAVAFKLRCFKYPQKVWSGPILIPNSREAQKQICTGILGMDQDHPEPKTALFLYRMNPEILKAIGDGKNGDMIVVHAFDARGEEAGREAFGWALNIPGVIDRTRYQTMKELAMMQNGVGALTYTQTFYWTGIALARLSEDILMKSFEWYDECSMAANDSLGSYSSLVFELFCTSESKSGRLSSGWPRPPGFKHMILIQSGSPGRSAADDVARELAMQGPSFILGPSANRSSTANAIEDFHDVQEIYGENYEKLKELKRQYDSKNRLNGWIKV